MKYQPLNFARKLDLVDELWNPRVIAEMNDYQFKLVRVQGDFVWHDHPDTDETFIVLDGELRIDFVTARLCSAPVKCLSCRQASNTSPLLAMRSGCC